MPKRKAEEITNSLIKKIEEIKTSDPLLTGIATNFIEWMGELSDDAIQFFDRDGNRKNLKPFLEIVGASNVSAENIAAVSRMIHRNDLLQKFVDQKEEMIEVLNICIERDILKYISPMQSFRGVISKVHLQELTSWCSFGGELNEFVMKSVCKMRSGKGMIAKQDFDNLINLCCNEKGIINSTMLSLVVMMQYDAGVVTADVLTELQNAKAVSFDHLAKKVHDIRSARKTSKNLAVPGIINSSNNSDDEKIIFDLLANGKPILASDLVVNKKVFGQNKRAQTSAKLPLLDGNEDHDEWGSVNVDLGSNSPLPDIFKFSAQNVKNNSNNQER